MRDAAQMESLSSLAIETKVGEVRGIVALALGVAVALLIVGAAFLWTRVIRNSCRFACKGFEGAPVSG